MRVPARSGAARHRPPAAALMLGRALHLRSIPGGGRRGIRQGNPCCVPGQDGERVVHQVCGQSSWRQGGAVQHQLRVRRGADAYTHKRACMACGNALHACVHAAGRPMLAGPTASNWNLHALWNAHTQEAAEAVDGARNAIPRGVFQGGIRAEEGGSTRLRGSCMRDTETCMHVSTCVCITAAGPCAMAPGGYAARPAPPPPHATLSRIRVHRGRVHCGRELRASGTASMHARGASWHVLHSGCCNVRCRQRARAPTRPPARPPNPPPCRWTRSRAS